MPVRCRACAAAAAGAGRDARARRTASRRGDDPRRRALVDVEVAAGGLQRALQLGTIWIAEAPVPMTATRLPARSTSWFQRAGGRGRRRSARCRRCPAAAVPTGCPRRRPGWWRRPSARRAVPGSATARPARRRPQVASSKLVSSSRGPACRSARRHRGCSLDLRLRRVGHRPLGVQCERVGVELARDVAGRAGVGALSRQVPPTSAPLSTTREVGLAVLLELDRRAEAGGRRRRPGAARRSGARWSTGGQSEEGMGATVLALLKSVNGVGP